MKNVITTENLNELEIAKKNEYDRYLLACSRGGEGFTIDDFPLIKAEMQKQEVEKQETKKQEVQKQITVKKTEIVNPVDNWLFNSIKEDIKNDRYVTDIDRKWFEEELQRRFK